MPSPTISVITATAGGRFELLQRKLAALVGQDLEPTRIQWVISDDGGREPELESLAAQGPPFEIKVVRLPDASGPGAARNAALAAAEGDVIYLSDDDCSPSSGTLRAHAEAVAGGDTVSVGAVRFEPAAGEPTTWTAKRARWWNVNGANTAVRADVLREVGGFDESLKGYGVEDVLLGYELRRRGLRFVGLPAAIAVHYGADPMAGDDLLKPESAGRNATLVARRYPQLSMRLGVSLPLLLVKRALLPPLAATFGGRYAAELAYARGAWEERRGWRNEA